MRQITLTTLLCGLLIMAGYAQTYSVSNEQSKLEVLGTSTLHDWTIRAEQLSGNAEIKTEANGLEITSLTFKVKSESLKSGKSAMDNNTYKALNTKDHPTIQFTLKRVSNVQQQGSNFKLTGVGDLTIAGYTKSVTLPVTVYNGGKTIAFYGETSFKMTDFKVEPPTALMGTIKTGDQVTINFNVKYSR